MHAAGSSRSAHDQRFIAVISQRHFVAAMDRNSEGNGKFTRGRDDPLRTRKGSAAHPGYSSSVKLRVLGRLGWNSYGIEGTQRVSRVRTARSPKSPELAANRCRRLPPAAVWIPW